MIKFRKLLAAPVVVLIASVSADPIERATLWEWADGSAEPVQSCEVDTYQWEFANNGRAYYETHGLWGHGDGPYPNRVLLPHDAAIVHIDDTGTRRSSVTYSVDGDGHPYISASSLRDAASATEAYLETEVSTWENFYTGSAVIDLMSQWFDHWCSDPGNRCDPIARPNGDSVDLDGIYRVFPPMRAAHQAELAQCLERHERRKLRSVRREYQITGAGNWPEQLLWAAECPHDAPERPTVTQPLQGSSAPVNQQACALFQSFLAIWFEVPFIPSASSFLGDGNQVGSMAYLCDLRQPVYHGFSVADYTGHQVRYWAEQREGVFPGFTCPTVEEGSSAPSADEMQFDTTSLRRFSRIGQINSLKPR